MHYSRSNWSIYVTAHRVAGGRRVLECLLWGDAPGDVSSPGGDGERGMSVGGRIGSCEGDLLIRRFTRTIGGGGDWKGSGIGEEPLGASHDDTNWAGPGTGVNELLVVELIVSAEGDPDAVLDWGATKLETMKSITYNPNY